jgi:hypothetical protein
MWKRKGKEMQAAPEVKQSDVRQFPLLETLL